MKVICKMWWLHDEWLFRFSYWQQRTVYPTKKVQVTKINEIINCYKNLRR